MILTTINSGSRGNGFLLEADDGQQLLIEAGCRLKDYQNVGHLKIACARGMLISHEHG
jgi:phosphoribosyl 1,2-cyclic phosphodiesterase